MNDIESTTNALRRSITEFLVPIQTGRAVDPSKFVTLEQHARRIAGLLKGKEHLPRPILYELYVTIGVLRAEAVHCESHDLGKMADKLEMVFGLILRGEVPGERISGVPRVI